MGFSYSQNIQSTNLIFPRTLNTCEVYSVPLLPQIKLDSPLKIEALQQKAGSFLNLRNLHFSNQHPSFSRLHLFRQYVKRYLYLLILSCHQLLDLSQKLCDSPSLQSHQYLGQNKQQGNCFEI